MWQRSLYILLFSQWSPVERGIYLKCMLWTSWTLYQVVSITQQLEYCKRGLYLLILVTQVSSRNSKIKRVFWVGAVPNLGILLCANTKQNHALSFNVRLTTLVTCKLYEQQDKKIKAFNYINMDLGLKIQNKTAVTPCHTNCWRQAFYHHNK